MIDYSHRPHRLSNASNADRVRTHEELAESSLDGFDGVQQGLSMRQRLRSEFADLFGGPPEGNYLEWEE